MLLPMRRTTLFRDLLYGLDERLRDRVHLFHIGGVCKICMTTGKRCEFMNLSEQHKEFHADEII